MPKFETWCKLGVLFDILGELVCISKSFDCRAHHSYAGMFCFICPGLGYIILA